MKAKLYRGLLWITAGFVLMLLMRLIYGYLVYPNVAADLSGVQTYPRNAIEQDVGRRDSGFSSKKNYASYKMTRSPVAGNAPRSVDQKYEKIGTLDAHTQQFESDEKKLRELIKNFNSIVQYEQNFGLKNSRRLNMSLGVIPEKFDEFIPQLKQIGTVAFFQIDKNDKTNEYSELKAKKLTLEKSRDSLKALSARSNASVKDLIELENKILELSSHLQQLGVNLGEFSEENQFCTVKFSLREQRAASVTKIPFLQRLMRAFEWALKYYTLLLSLLLIALIGLLLLFTLVQKSKTLMNTLAQLAGKSADK